MLSHMLAQNLHTAALDGIQVSTGATLGMGTIHLAADEVKDPLPFLPLKDGQ
jgi:hypothetical protein